MTRFLFMTPIRLPNGQQVGTLQVYDEVEETGRSSNLYNHFTGEYNVTTISGLLSLDFFSTRARQAHWLQFLWKEVVVTTGRGTMRLSGGVGNHDEHATHQVPYTVDPSSNATRRWTVDSLSDASDPLRVHQPWYEFGGLRNIKNLDGELDLQDAPISDPDSDFARIASNDFPSSFWRGERGRAPFVTPFDHVSMAYIWHFDTYLVIVDGGSTRTLYHVEWTTKRTITNPLNDPHFPPRQIGEPTHAVERHGPVNRLPDHLRRVIRREYPAFEYQLCYPFRRHPSHFHATLPH